MQVRESRAAAEKAQKLLQNVSNRKRTRQAEAGGLVITKALYGSSKAFKRMGEIRVADDLASEVLDVTIPLNFLVNDLGQLKVSLCVLFYLSAYFNGLGFAMPQMVLMACHPLFQTLALRIYH